MAESKTIKFKNVKELRSFFDKKGDSPFSDEEIKLAEEAFKSGISDSDGITAYIATSLKESSKEDDLVKGKDSPEIIEVLEPSLEEDAPSFEKILNEAPDLTKAEKKERINKFITMTRKAPYLSATKLIQDAKIYLAENIETKNGATTKEIILFWDGVRIPSEGVFHIRG